MVRSASRRRSVLKMLYSVSSAVNEPPVSGSAFGGAGGALFKALAGAGAERLQNLLQLRFILGEVLIYGQ